MKTKAYSDNVIEFVTVANEYLHLVEDTAEYTKDQYVTILVRLLPFLYLKATMLPEMDSDFDEEQNKYVTEEQYEAIREIVEKKLGSHDNMIQVPDQISTNDEMGLSPVSEVLADIYQDLKDFVISYHTGTEDLMVDAVYSVHLGFETYWGQRLLLVLSELHNIRFSGDILDDELPPEENTDEESGKNTNDWIFTQRQKMWGYDE